MNEVDFFQDLAIITAIAGLVAVIFSRFGWPKVLGYIGAGVLMSKHTWGGSFLVNPDSVQITGQLGIVFLMFAMGLSFSPREMRRIRNIALPAAIFDIIVMIWLGYTIGTRAFCWSPVQSVFLGVAMCDSATTLLAKVLEEMGWSGRQFAKCVLGTSICEDILCVGAIAVATGLANGNGMSAGVFAASLWWLAVFFLTVLVFGFILVPRMLVSIGKRKDDEALVLAVLGTCFFVSFLAYRYEFSLALGAFLVGIVCGSSHQRERILSLVGPLKSMFAAIFFVSIGLLVDPAAMLLNLPEILLISAVVIGGKLMNILIASLATGVGVKTAVQNAFSLAQIGEFAFMVAILYAGLVGDGGNPMFQIAVGASLLTTLLNPFMIRISDPIGNFVERKLPVRFRSWLATYQAWIDKIGASSGTPAFVLFRNSAVRLGVYAVLMVSVAATCLLLCRVDYSRFSEFFERHDEIFFFLLLNLFSVSLLPLIVSAARSLADEASVLLAGEGSSKWQLSVQNLVRFVVVVAVLALFFIEWAMINVAIAPTTALINWITVVSIVLVSVLGWRFFLKAGRRATQRFQEALTAEERRESLAKTMTITVPEGTIHPFTLDAASPAVGESVVTLNIRAKTGASIVSVYRDGQITRNIGPEWEFAVGDTLIALGEAHQIAALKDLLGVTS